MAPSQTSESSRQALARLPHRVSEQRWEQICASFRARSATLAPAADNDVAR